MLLLSCAVLHALRRVPLRPVLSCAGGVLVHCLAGMSRSASICIAYIMWKQRLSYVDVSVSGDTDVQHAHGSAGPRAFMGEGIPSRGEGEGAVGATPLSLSGCLSSSQQHVPQGREQQDLTPYWEHVLTHCAPPTAAAAAGARLESNPRRPRRRVTWYGRRGPSSNPTRALRRS